MQELPGLIGYLMNRNGTACPGGAEGLADAGDGHHVGGEMFGKGEPLPVRGDGITRHFFTRGNDPLVLAPEVDADRMRRLQARCVLFVVVGVEDFGSRHNGGIALGVIVTRTFGLVGLVGVVLTAAFVTWGDSTDEDPSAEAASRVAADAGSTDVADASVALVAILPFEVRSEDPRLVYLRMGLPHMMALELERRLDGPVTREMVADPPPGQPSSMV